MRKMSLFFLIILLTFIGKNIQYAYGDYELMATWGSYGSGDGQFKYPEGIAMGTDGSVFVVDTQNFRIQKFDSSGTFVSKWGSYGVMEGQFYYPWRIAQGKNGYIYVADQGNWRIQKFDAAGSFITMWGSPGSGGNQFNAVSGGPYGIAVDADGYVYAADTYNNRIQKFDAAGSFITMWGSRGSGEGQFVNPYGIATGTDGFVYVADTIMCRIQKFDSSGTFITKWGSYGVNEGQFGSPYGVAVDKDGDVYVADTQNCRIQKFDSSGVFLSAWGDCNEEFYLPYDVAVDRDGYVYVLDTNQEHIDKYVESESCAVSFLLDTEQEKINLIRNLKDKILTSTREGKEYVQLFYEHSPEIISIMKRNPAIKEEAYALLQTLLTDVLSRLLGDRVAVATGAIAEIEKLCDAVSINASPSLKKAINRLKADLKDGELLKKFGIEAAKP